jgi:hypothetical protein
MEAPKPRPSQEAVYNQRAALVKEMTAKENLATEKKTARLKALRLAREAEDAPKRRK